VHNGYLEAKRYSPPINRLFFTPRGQKLKDIVARYPFENTKDRQAREKQEAKERERLRKKDIEDGVAEKINCKIISSTRSY